MPGPACHAPISAIPLQFRHVHVQAPVPPREAFFMLFARCPSGSTSRSPRIANRVLSRIPRLVELGSDCSILDLALYTGLSGRTLHHHLGGCPDYVADVGSNSQTITCMSCSRPSMPNAIARSSINFSLVKACCRLLSGNVMELDHGPLPRCGPSPASWSGVGLQKCFENGGFPVR